MPVHHSGNRCRVDIAEVVVDEDVAKATDFAPGDFGVTGFYFIRQLFRRLRQGLQVAQSGVVQHLILGQITAGLDVPDALNGIQNVQSVRLPRFGHRSTTSRST